MIMPATSLLFKRLLDKSVQRVKLEAGIDIGIIEDELGFTLGRHGRSYVQYLRKGHLPTEKDLEALTCWLVSRQGLDKQGCEQFLRSAKHSAPKHFTDQLFPSPAPMIKHKPADLSSPYLYGPPITKPYLFFGRERELTRIFNCWQRPYMEHVAIIGPHRSGKSSLLHYLPKITRAPLDQVRPGQKTDWLPRPEEVTWVMVDFCDVRMQQLGYLLRYLQTELGLPVLASYTLADFMEAAVHHTWTRPCLVLIDEVEAALSAPDLPPALWDSMRSLVSYHTNGLLAFAITSRKALHKLSTRRGQTSLFFNMFHAVALNALTESEAMELIHCAGLPFTDEDARWIVEQSACWPCLIQQLCQTYDEALRGNLALHDWREEALQRLTLNRHLLQLRTVSTPQRL